MARLTLRLDFGAWGAIGPGKIRLLEMIGKHGSISAAGRAMGMSYRRAWLLVDSLNQMFKKPLVTTERGGGRGGGAILTPLGKQVAKHYRGVESAASRAAAIHIGALQRALAAKPAGR
jgi:molybdate transport system regulatory protein